MIVERADLLPLKLELKRPLQTARRLLHVREGWLLKLHLSDGRVGHGEAMPHPFCPASELEQTDAALREVRAKLEGVALPSDLADIESLVDEPSPLRRAPAARHAVECALLDALAQVRGVPMSALLRPSESASQQATIVVNALLTEESPEALAVEARRAVESGFGTLKVKVGLGARVDEARLQAVREAVGHEVRLRVDANGGWSVEEAREALHQLSRFGLELCEQPVAAHDVAGLRTLREEGACRIAADEAVVSEAAARELVPGGDAAAADVLVIRPMVLGGLLPALRTAEWAKARSVAAYVASGLDGVHARAAAAQVAAAMGEGELAHGLGVDALFQPSSSSPYAKADPYAAVRGRVALPSGAGLGMTGEGAA